jgi:hypothetical protein
MNLYYRITPIIRHKMEMYRATLYAEDGRTLEAVETWSAAGALDSLRRIAKKYRKRDQA